MRFQELDLHPALIAAIEKLNFAECTPVQAATMPVLLEGKDVAGLAQTGTGKTAAFLLPLMERILRARPGDTANETASEEVRKRAFPEWRANQFILVLVPTRELCEQVYENALSLRGESGLRAVSIYGGVSYEKQKQGLRDGVEFIIATPGRLIDLYKEHLVDLKNVRAICFDEADRMFDMGFKDDMKYILQRVPKERQFLVFSATLNLDVHNTAYQFGANPVEVDVSRDQAKADNVDDKIFHVGQEEKANYLVSVLRKHKPRQTIVFSNFKMNVPRITQFLSDNGLPALGISSLLTQAQRTRVMEQFKGDNDSNILVATDVAARGLDIKGVDMVVNFELPDDPENYVHRIGRTGRAGEKGIAFSFVSDRDIDALGRVEEYLRHKVASGWMDDAEIVKDIKPMPSEYSLRRVGFTGAPQKSDSRGPRPPRSGGAERGRDGEGRSSGGRDSRPGRNDRGPRRDGPRDGPHEAGRDGGREGNRDGRDGGREFNRDGRPHSRDRNRGPRDGEAGVNGAPQDSANSGAQSARHGSGGPNGGPGGFKRRPLNSEGRGPNGDRGGNRHGNSHHGRNGNRDGRPHGKDSGKHAGSGNGPTPRHKQSGPRPANKNGAPSSAGSSIGKKVSGFFKKIFGG